MQSYIPDEYSLGVEYAQPLKDELIDSIDAGYIVSTGMITTFVAIKGIEGRVIPNNGYARTLDVGCDG